MLFTKLLTLLILQLLTAPTAAIGAAAAAARLQILLELLLLLRLLLRGVGYRDHTIGAGGFVDKHQVNAYFIGASCFFTNLTNLSTARLCQTAVEHRGTNDESTSFALDVQCNQECALNMV